jgi:glycosyltransferase involved in cell wall biosynthesis
MDTTAHAFVVAIDARLESGVHGGVEQVIIGLAHGLSGLVGPERYVFVCHEGYTSWLAPYVSGPCRIETTRPPLRRYAARRFPLLAVGRRRLLDALRRGAYEPPPVPHSDGTVEQMGARVVHFPRQDGYLTDIPTIFHPHDLQHIHLPEFMSPEERRHRDVWYRTLCDQAAVVSVTSHWGKGDLVENFAVPAEKIVVVPLAPALGAYGEQLADREPHDIIAELGVASPYALYPAQTWPHKNHERLIRAIAMLRDAGVRVELVCTGAKNQYFPEVQEVVSELRLDDQVHFLGYVTERQLQALYAGARCLVMPTLFEAAGGFGPIAEAFSAGVAVACSNVTSLPEQVGDAAIVFDPYDVAAIAAALSRLWTDGDLRLELTRRASVKIRAFTWDRVARTFRALYRRLAGENLNDEDRSLLERQTEF